MRTDKLMINADPETIAAFKRALGYKVAAALTLVLGIAMIAVTAPDNNISNSSMTPAIEPAYEPAHHGANLGRGSDINDPVTRGVDMHG